MYTVTCDGKVLHAPGSDEASLIAGSLSLAPNRIGSGELSLAPTHPHYSSPEPLTTTITITRRNGNEQEIVFRGRVTSEKIDRSGVKHLELESSLGSLRDTASPPHSFPEAWENKNDYKHAAANNTVVEYYLAALLEEHNKSSAERNKIRLGNVTVKMQDFAIASEEYASTWDRLENAVAVCGGSFTVRYENDGNYLDLLTAPEMTNKQMIAAGENIIDLTKEINAENTISAVLPLGEQNGSPLTVKKLPNAPVSILKPDIVVDNEIVCSKKNVEKYGIRLAPISETTWSDISDATTLALRAAAYLEARLAPTESIHLRAVDLCAADKTIAPLRVDQKLRVRLRPDSPAEEYTVEKLEIDLTRPENTYVTIGKTRSTLTEQESSRSSTLARLLSSYKSKSRESSSALRAEIAETYALKSDLDALRDEIAALRSSVGGET